MPNEYSITIHNYLSEEIAAQQQILELAQSHPQTREYARGKLNELQWIRTYLAEHTDLKDFPYY